MERPSTILDVDPTNSLLIVPDPFGTLEMSDAPGKFLSLQFLIFFNSCTSSLTVFLDILLYFDAFFREAD